MKFSPKNGKIAVKLMDVQKTESGIYIPDNAVGEGTIKAQVVAVSVTFKDGKQVPPPAEVGQIAVFRRGTGVPVKADQGDLIVLNPEEILGVFIEE